MEIKQEFFKYIGPKGTLNNALYQKSYKLILLLSLLTLADDEGKADYDKVCEEIRKFYIDRHNKGLPVEESNSRIQKEIDGLSLNTVKSIMNENSYNVINEKGYIFKENIEGKEYLYFNKELWHAFNDNDIKELKENLEEKLYMYYQNRFNDNDTLKQYVETIMNSYLYARQYEHFAGHELGELVRKTIPEYFMNLSFIDQDKYVINGSIGQGNWAKVPWIAIMNKQITTTTQKGIYIVYLFSQDMKRLYLTLNQGVTEIEKEHGKRRAEEILLNKSKSIREKLGIKEKYILDEIDLGDNKLAEMYEAGTICGVKYDVDKIPDDNELINDLMNIFNYYESFIRDREDKVSIIEDNLTPTKYLEHIHKYITNQGYTYSIDTIKNFYLSLKAKPFVILAGISGTGKSKLVELFARAIGATSENGRFNMISVKPDWSDSADLLGYKTIEDKFQPGPLTTIIKRAMDNPNDPYFVCLDEMNLARVEYYFSDILSIIETRRKNGRIETDKLFKKEVFGKDNESRKEYGDLIVPDNLYIIGTVNMDETTFPFSKKVLDRANTIEFNEVDLSINFEDLISQEYIDSMILSNENLCSKYINIKDCKEEKEYKESIIKTVDILEELNEILKKEGLHFGFRVRDEIIFYVIYAIKEGLMNFDKAIDYSVKQKILPRIQGSSFSIKEMLLELYYYFIDNNRIKYDPRDNGIYEEIYKYLHNNEVRHPICARKVAYMIRRYDSDGFTTFWE